MDGKIGIAPPPAIAGTGLRQGRAWHSGANFFREKHGNIAIFSGTWVNGSVSQRLRAVFFYVARPLAGRARHEQEGSMAMNKVPMTAQGHEALKEELRWRQQEERPRIIEAISEARSHGDLSENAEYHAAKEAQSLNEGRINELEDFVARAEVIDVSKLSGDKISSERSFSWWTRTLKKKRPIRLSATRKPM